ncbi:cholestenol Delta-isomerase [Trypanosoma conorhini]|uniref:Cholestenol Delta-isomerase n=1 Tax=Trypanosoma conorhini TaxID=83891 RepID=A0A422NRW0_9TRYP|nr:cholestenol Delta-isomerase [Trypanosoma conorhini]RNF08217.1 cholestenol Delta-isomerase [Trypanosoma conorhini]
MATLELPLLAKLWFLLTAPVVLIDGVFVLTRSSSPSVPHPLADTPPFNWWVLYATYDRRYAPNDDAFVVVQSWMNMLEVALGILALVLSHRGSVVEGLQLALVVSVMTLYKTVLYLAMEVVEGGKYTKHNSTFDTLMMTVLPSSFWIIVPAMLIVQCGRRLSGAVPGSKAAPQKRKKIG